MKSLFSRIGGKRSVSWNRCTSLAFAKCAVVKTSGMLNRHRPKANLKMLNEKEFDFDRLLSLRAKFERSIPALTTLILFIGATVYLQNWPEIWDISLWDETTYMANGIYVWNIPFSVYEGSPLYSYLYKLLHILISPPVELFLSMGLIGVTSAIITIYFATWYISRSLLLASAAFCLLILSNFMMSEPRLIYPAITILLLGAAIGFSMKVFFVRSIILALTCFLVAFIRPEFALAFQLFKRYGCFFFPAPFLVVA